MQRDGRNYEVDQDLMNDLLHPSDKGHPKLAQCVLDASLEIVKSFVEDSLEVQWGKCSKDCGGGWQYVDTDNCRAKSTFLDGLDPGTVQQLTRDVCKGMKDTRKFCWKPCPVPTEAPTAAPTVAPTMVPTLAPTAAPTPLPTEAPTLSDNQPQLASVDTAEQAGVEEQRVLQGSQSMSIANPVDTNREEDIEADELKADEEVDVEDGAELELTTVLGEETFHSADNTAEPAEDITVVKMLSTNAAKDESSGTPVASRFGLALICIAAGSAILLLFAPL
eukprot:scaffold389362_cov32-Prasinocladus_malaysianus.AAC.1